MFTLIGKFYIIELKWRTSYQSSLLFASVSWKDVKVFNKWNKFWSRNHGITESWHQTQYTLVGIECEFNFVWMYYSSLAFHKAANFWKPLTISPLFKPEHITHSASFPEILREVFSIIQPTWYILIRVWLKHFMYYVTHSRWYIVFLPIYKYIANCPVFFIIEKEGDMTHWGRGHLYEKFSAHPHLLALANSPMPSDFYN